MSCRIDSIWLMIFVTASLRWAQLARSPHENVHQSWNPTSHFQFWAKMSTKLTTLTRLLFWAHHLGVRGFWQSCCLFLDWILLQLLLFISESFGVAQQFPWYIVDTHLSWSIGNTYFGILKTYPKINKQKRKTLLCNISKNK